MSGVDLRGRLDMHLGLHLSKDVVVYPSNSRTRSRSAFSDRLAGRTCFYAWSLTIDTHEVLDLRSRGSVLHWWQDTGHAFSCPVETNHIRFEGIPRMMWVAWGVFEVMLPSFMRRYIAYDYACGRHALSTVVYSLQRIAQTGQYSHTAKAQSLKVCYIAPRRYPWAQSPRIPYSEQLRFRPCAYYESRSATVHF